jgi:hypothetical protein
MSLAKWRRVLPLSVRCGSVGFSEDGTPGRKDFGKGIPSVGVENTAFQTAR